MRSPVPPFVILICTILFSCRNNAGITNKKDYEVFLIQENTEKQVIQTEKELFFWEKRLQRDTANFVDMTELANCHYRLFKITGQIHHLKTSDSLLARSSDKLKGKDPEILFALSQMSATRHRFRNAEGYNEAAQKAEGSAYISCLLGFDTDMELGKYREAAKQIERLTDKSSFDYLIRKSKLEDHRGNLDDAIKLMEKAFKKVVNKDKSLYCWSLSNLGDMYGHAGRIRDSYNAYLKVLQKDSGYLYALKGIAWIAYSYDNNTAEAKRILHYILSQTKMPDLFLTLAEIEEGEGNEANKTGYLRQFLEEAEKPEYEGMYNKYLIQLYSDEFADLDKALVLAGNEVSDRPTPETYDWLSWVYYTRGDKEKAYNLNRTYVYKQTYEPDAVFHTALIFAGKGKKKEAKKMLKECLESSFEMGPLTEAEIRELLRSL